MKRTFFLALLAFLLLACGTLELAPQPTYTPLPTYTPYPTSTPILQLTLTPAATSSMTINPSAPTTTATKRISATPASKATSSSASTPTKTSVANSSIIRFVSVDGAPPNGTASVTVQTTTGASCAIQYTTPSGNISTALGLVNRTADGSGAVSWSWKIGPTTRPGSGTVKVTCNGQTATASINIQ